MAESDDFQVLKITSTEVVNSQIKILFSSHCMKAQAFLLDKLRKQTERQKEICKFIGSSNLKLEMEIQLAEQEVKSLKIANETIEHGNIELHKEYLLSKERKAEILERTNLGKRKYENLWLTSKKKYENIPIVQKFIEIKNKNQTIQANITSLINEYSHLGNQIKIRKIDIENMNRARIIELAEFLVRERPKIIIRINENSVKINEVLNEIEKLKEDESKDISMEPQDQSLAADQKQAVDTMTNSSLEINWPRLNENTEKDSVLFPKLHLRNKNKDILSVKFDQIQKVDLQNTPLMKRPALSLSSCLEENMSKIQKTDEKNMDKYISYFGTTLDIGSDNNDKRLENNNYSEKKLIHILEDVKLDKNDAYKIINKLELSQYHETKYITSKNIYHDEKTSNLQDKEMKPMEIEEIKDVDTYEKREDVVDPPSQFLDISQSSQEKKTVSFNIPVEKEISNLIEEVEVNSEGVDNTKSQDKIGHSSTVTQESYPTSTDNVLKQHNLDLSPEFVYSKSTLTHTQPEDKITSKFFINEGVCQNNDKNDDQNKIINQDQILKGDEKKLSLIHQHEMSNQDDIAVSSPKGDNKNSRVPIAGFLFNHGPQGIPESLDLSISTTGLEDSEDFPQYIDSSLLLSPKADIPAIAENSKNNEVLPQEMPNFLGGFRKTGIAFFGSAASNSKPDSGAQSQTGSFSFVFGNEEKKGRGGFFSMFH